MIFLEKIMITYLILNQTPFRFQEFEYITLFLQRFQGNLWFAYNGFFNIGFLQNDNRKSDFHAVKSTHTHLAISIISSPISIEFGISISNIIIITEINNFL